MPAMATVPGGRDGSRVAVTVSPREREASATAQPRKSKPGPRLATVAGAKAVTDLKAGDGSGPGEAAAEAATLNLLETRRDSTVALRVVEGKEVAGDGTVAAAAAILLSACGVGFLCAYWGF